MGYTLEIGEAEIDWNTDRVGITARGEKHDDAPAYGEPTDYTNGRWPGYCGWANFAKATGLEGVFFGTAESKWEFLVAESVWVPVILAHHPGAVPVTSDLRNYINAKYAEYVAAHPDHRAEYPPAKPGAKPVFGTFYREEDYVEDPRYDANLCRFEWLRYWINWAVDNCQCPVFTNS